MPLPPGFDQKMSVYERTAGTGPPAGRYDGAPIITGVACRLAHVNRRAVANAVERAELNALRTLIWDPDVDVPENAQIAVVGDPDRYNVVKGTMATMRGPDGQPMYKRVDARRA